MDLLKEIWKTIYQYSLLNFQSISDFFLFFFSFIFLFFSTMRTSIQIEQKILFSFSLILERIKKMKKIFAWKKFNTSFRWKNLFAGNFMKSLPLNCKQKVGEKWRKAAFSIWKMMMLSIKSTFPKTYRPPKRFSEHHRYFQTKSFFSTYLIVISSKIAIKT